MNPKIYYSILSLEIFFTELYYIYTIFILGFKIIYNASIKITTNLSYSGNLLSYFLTYMYKGISYNTASKFLEHFKIAIRKVPSRKLAAEIRFYYVQKSVKTPQKL